MWLLPSFRRVASLTAALLCGVLLTVTARAASTSGDINITVAPPVAASCAKGPQLVTDKSNYAPGEPITVTTTCGSGNPKDWVGVVTHYNEVGPSDGPYFAYLGSTTANATATLHAPNAIFDRDQQYRINWYLNDGFNHAGTSLPFTVNKSVSPPAPVATLPVSLAADPFTPAHVVTVCASGCDYTDLGGATSAAIANNWDNVQIKISSGEYEFPTSTLATVLPAHLWIKGIAADGKSYPHLFGITTSSSRMLGNSGVHWATNAGSVTLDNLELGPWNYWTAVVIDGQTWTLRNVYVRDTAEGLISGNTIDFTLNIYNSVFSRSGGPDGPEHNVYVGLGNNGNIVNIVNSVFDQSVIGHSFKERAKVFNASCSIFAVNEDDFYRGSETIDMDSGQVTLTNIVSVNGAGPPKAYTDNSSWDSIRWGVDNEGNLTPASLTLTGSTFVADQPFSAHWFVSLGIPMTSPPITWSRNKFVWPDAGARSPGLGGADQADPTGVIWAHPRTNGSDVTFDSSANQFFIGRAAAGLPSVTYPAGWRDYLPLMPAACTDPIGLVKIPTN